MGVIRVYEMYEDNVLKSYLGRTEFDEKAISFEHFKWNREQTYNFGKKVYFKFKYCYS